jgi:hypothetical protein
LPADDTDSEFLDPGLAAHPERLVIDVWPVDRLRPRRRKTRDNSAADEPVLGSLARYGWQQNIVIRPDGEIVAGEAVWRAAMLAGATEVPVHVMDEAEQLQRGYAVDDNRTHDEARWHYPKLQVELQDLAEAGVSADHLAFPFDELAEIAALAARGGEPAPVHARGAPIPTGFVQLNVPVTPAQKELLVSMCRLLVQQGQAPSHADALELICREWHQSQGAAA